MCYLWVWITKNFVISDGLLQILQTLFKYEPYPGFNASVQVKIKADIEEWKENKQKLS